MASLTGVSVASSYTSLLKLNGNTDTLLDGDGSNAIQVVDGDGTISPLFLNKDRLGIGGQPSVALHVTGDIQLDDSAPFLIFKETGSNKDMQFKLQTDGRMSLLNDNASTEVLTVLQSGQLGIGSSAPDAWSYTNPVLTLSGGTTANNYVAFNLGSYSTSTTGIIGDINFTQFASDGTTGAERAIIRSLNDGATDSVALKFYTTPTGGNVTDRMIIDSSGSVGIGTSAPNEGNLVVQDDTKAELVIKTSASATDTEASLMFKTSTDTDDIRKKGGIIYKDVGDNGVGDMFFVLDSATDNGNATVADDTAMVIKNDGTADHKGNYIVNEQGRQNHVANTMSSPYYRFDGVDDKITISANASINDLFDVGGTFSFCVYVNSDGGNNGGRIINKRVSGNGFLVSTISESGDNVTLQLAVEFSTTDGKWTIPLSKEKWHHIAITYDNSSVANNPTIYLNGVSQTVTEAQTPVGTRLTDAGQDLLIGNDTGGAVAFDGQIQCVQAFNLTLSATEVKELYSGASVPFKYKGANQTDLVTSNWADSGGGTAYTTVSSVSANGFTATETGSSSDTRAISADEIVLVKGKSYRASFDVTLNSGQIPAFGIRESYSSGNYAASNVDLDDVSSGANSIEFVSLYSGTFQALFRNTANTNYTIANFNLVPIGAVAEYDGSGIASDKWFDKSGNDLHGTVSGATVENAPSGDDGLVYEEGTWNCQFFQSSNQISFASQTATYKRVGDKVTVFFSAYDVTSSGTTTTGQLQIRNFPYTAKSNMFFVGTNVGYYGGISFATSGDGSAPFVFLGGGTTTANIYTQSDGAGVANATIDAVGANSSFAFSVTYEI